MKDISGFVQSYQKNILGTLVLFAVVTGGVYYYRSSRLGQEERAHMALSETLHQLHGAFRNQTTWQEVGLAADTGYHHHKNTSLAPYFLAVKAEAALHQNDRNEAKKCMETLLDDYDLSSSSPLRSSFQLKYARILIDSKDEAEVLHGFQELEKLAQDSTPANTVQDAALYYLGNYYAARNDMVRAREAWQNLVQKFTSKTEDEASPWAQIAEVHLR